MVHVSDQNPHDTDVRKDVLASELAIEQAHVDAVYARLTDATLSAKSVGRPRARRSTTPTARRWVREEDGTALFERDAFAYQAAKRLADPGRRARGPRLRTPRSHRPRGPLHRTHRRPRRRLRAARHRLARAGGRALLPGHAEQPDGRHPPPRAALPQRQGRRHRGRPAGPRGQPRRPADHRRGRADGGAVARPRPPDARHRRDDPGRAGRGDPRRPPRRHRHLAAGPAPARPWWPCTAPPTCSTPTVAASSAAASWWSAPARCS